MQPCLNYTGALTVINKHSNSKEIVQWIQFTIHNWKLTYVNIYEIWENGIGNSLELLTRISKTALLDFFLVVFWGFFSILSFLHK